MPHCKNCQNQFEITSEDRAYYKKISVPEPTLCPDCRLQRRMAWRNERNLYHRTCDFSGKKFVSVFSQDKPFKVYSPNIWWSDKWEALKYGQDMDFSRPFFEQFKELLCKVPLLGIINVNAENSDYTNQGYSNKNCYMTITADFCEDCYYVDSSFSSKNCTDCLSIHKCELCYSCLDCANCYGCFFCQGCHNCNDTWFSTLCRGCSNCFGCTGLRNKQYYAYNKPLSKEEWTEKFSELVLSHSLIEDIKKQANEERLKVPHPFATMHGCQDCTGDFLTSCKNAVECYDGQDIEDSRRVILVPLAIRDCFDCLGIGGGELIYESHSTGPAYNAKFCAWCWNDVANLSYCFLCCNNSKNLFGCVGLKHKEYCILNKQYKKDEYEKLLEKIIDLMKKTAEYGEFFPMEMSLFNYEESIAEQYFPRTGKHQKTSPVPPDSFKIPETFDEVQSDICNKTLYCEVTGKPYKIIKKEFDFYKKMKLPLPRRCPDQRNLDRLADRNPRQLFSRVCAKCNAPIQTTYSPDRPEMVYCEQCYLDTVY